MAGKPLTFRTRDFAKLAGVTVRALRHYDRIGLLAPRRTAAGYRVYSLEDLHTVEQIVVTKIARLQSLLSEQMAMLRTDWDTLVSEIRAALDERPLSPKAQELGTRWRELLTRVVGETIPAERLATHHATQEWSPQMATFVDKPVWDFMTRVLARRPEP